jgi:hypothetical protein
MFLGETEIAIGDQDVHRIRVFGRAVVSLSGDVAWENKPPDQPPSDKLGVSLEPMTRPFFPQEIANLYMSLTVPGEFTSRLIAGDYSIRLSNIPKGAYIKAITYGGLDALHTPIHVGQTVGSTLRIVLAHDGGTVSAKVVDKDGNPVPDCTVALLPADASTDAELAAALVSGQTDQYGQYTSGQLAPGKYFALATNASIDLTPETIMKLSRARAHAEDVELQPNANVQISLSPADLE